MGRVPVLLLGAALVLVQALPVGAAPGPLSLAEQRLLDEVPDEKPYNVRIHFLTSNEKRHDVFFPLLRGRGGVYVGVASDQNYTLSAMAESELLWLLDIDEQVVHWHRIYAALLGVAPTAAQLIALFSLGKDGQAREALLVRYGAAEAAVLGRAFSRDRARIAAHLRQEIGRVRDGQGLNWLSDPTLYARLRELALARRIQARVGDLHGESTLLAIGAAARAAHLMVRVFYISNVEQWFRYSPEFIKNLTALPRDGRSVVLRTLARLELRAPAGDRWHFSVQLLDEFIGQMTAAAPLRRVHDLMPQMTRADRAGLSLLGSLAPPPGLLSLRRLSWAHVIAPF